MSAEKHLIDTRLREYIETNFSADTDFLKELLVEANLKGFPDIHISPAQSQFLKILIKSISARNILEIGSLAGYSAFSMAEALEGNGRVVAIEKEPEYAEFIRSHSQKGGFGSVVEVINADANDYLTTYNPGAGFDLIFVDADKSSYINYMRHAERLLRPGGIFAADNCLGFGELFDRNPSRGEKTIRTIREFNNALRNNSVFTSTIVPLGDGIALGVKV